MLKSIYAGLIIILFSFSSPLSAANDSLTQADTLFSRDGIENLKKSIDLYNKAVSDNSESYEINWKCARAYRKYGEETKKKAKKGWKDICAASGIEGIRYAKKAIKLNKDNPEGHYYYGCNAATYSDGVSILRAIKEGLKGKTQKSFETAYELDKMYDKAGPILALARFWAVLPWPLRNRKLSLKYFREYQQTEYFYKEAMGLVYFSELLLQLKGKEYQSEARELLKIASKLDDSYYKDLASKFMDDLN